MSKQDFLDLIKKQRSRKKEKKFDGSLIDYVELVQANPSIAKLAHKRLYDAIYAHGVEEMSSENPRKRCFTSASPSLFKGPPCAP